MPEVPESISFREDFGMFWPNYDHKPEACYSRVTKRVRDLDVMIKRLPSERRRTVIQAGGHAGVWPKYLARVFKKVYTFEPEPALYQCLQRNVTAPNVQLSAFALGDTCTSVKLRPHVSAGSWRVDAIEGTLLVNQITIDALGLAYVDAIVLDVEGYEVNVLTGARGTIAQYKPIIMVEELDRSRQAIRHMLTSLGYREIDKVHSDHIWIPKR